MKIKLPEKMTNTLVKAAFKVQKSAPGLMFGAGLAGTVAGVIFACKATLKVTEVLEKANEDLDTIKDTYDAVNTMKLDPDDPRNIEYEKADYQRDLAIVYTRTAGKLIKLFGPALTIIGSSVALMALSHKILSDRAAAFAAAYTAVNTSFPQYRKRLKEELGEEKDLYFAHGVKEDEIEIKEIDKNGKEKVTKKKVQIVDTEDPTNHSMYAKFFDSSCKEWTKDPEYNLSYLIAQQRIANDHLKSRGHLFLNEVYDMLGIERTKIGQVVGWVYDEYNPMGDNYVDFGIHDMYSERGRAFVNGYENVILLDFNVDGDILSSL